MPKLFKYVSSVDDYALFPIVPAVARRAVVLTVLLGLAACQGAPSRSQNQDVVVVSTPARPTPLPSPIPTSPPGPVISGVKVATVTDSTATITWQTSRPSTSQIRYGPTGPLSNTTVLDGSPVVSHAQTIGGLTPGSTFKYAVVSGDALGTTTSPPATVTTATAPVSAATMGEWSQDMQWPLVDVHMSLLYTGELLMWDAWEFNGTPSTRLWNPSSLAFTPVPTFLSQMFCADETMLPDGRLLVSGGHNGADIGIKTVMVFDPLTRAWNRAADMNTSRWYPVTVALANGDVLALGGEITPDSDANVPEVFDPATNSWTPLTLATLDVGEYPHSYLLPDGRVFMDAGPDGKSRTLDIGTQQWTVIGTNPVSTGTSIEYRPGKILATGGGSGEGDPVQSIAATIDMSQPAPTWQYTAPMIYPRDRHNLVALPDGTVLAVGGSTQYSEVSTVGVLPAEIWDPSTGTWNLMAAAHDLRMYHSTAALLPDGRVLVAGGGRLPPAVDFLTAEIYSPPYLFKGPRPTIASAPAAISYGESVNVQTPDASKIASVALVRLASDTHNYDNDQRYVDLSFKATAGSLRVDTPTIPNLAPPGYYMLFLTDSKGIPSVAKILQIGLVPTTGAAATTVGVTTR
jgi:hypothetical protein